MAANAALSHRGRWGLLQAAAEGDIWWPNDDLSRAA